MPKQDITQALFEISNAVNTTSDLGELYQKIHQSLGKIVDTRNFYIAMYDSKTDYVQFPYFVDQKSAMRQGSGYYIRDRKASMTLRVIRTGKPILIRKQESIEYCRSLNSEPSGPMAEIWIGVPLKVRGEVMGVLAIQSYTDPDLYSERDVNILSTVSDQIALAIDRKRSEEELKEREKLISVLYRLSNAMHTTKSLDHLFKYIHDTLKGIIDAENFTIALYDRENDTLHFRYSSDQMDHTMINPVFKASQTSSLSFQVITQQKTLLLNESEKAEYYRQMKGKMIGTLSAKTWLGVPLRGKNDILGVVIIQNYNEADCYSKKEIRLLESVSEQIAFAIEYKRAEEELAKAQKELIEKAHKAGMTDVASDTLHNIGNILNSVKTSNNVIHDITRKSSLEGLNRALDLLRENVDTLEQFISSDSRGKKLVEYLLSLQSPLNREMEQIGEQSKRLAEKVVLMTNVIHAQQIYASGGYMEEQVNLADIVDTVLDLHADALNSFGIAIEKAFEAVPGIVVQKTKLSHVLMNLIGNAKDAMLDTPKEEKKLSITITQDQKAVYLKVKDTGHGIRFEDLRRVFNHGYTTKPEGHGFGLHNSANFMTEMRGAIWAESDGEGKGACFVLKFPKAEQLSGL